jgi:hypothetical protein
MNESIISRELRALQFAAKKRHSSMFRNTWWAVYRLEVHDAARSTFMHELPIHNRFQPLSYPALSRFAVVAPMYFTSYPRTANLLAFVSQVSHTYPPLALHYTTRHDTTPVLATARHTAGSLVVSYFLLIPASAGSEECDRMARVLNLNSLHRVREEWLGRRKWNSPALGRRNGQLDLRLFPVRCNAM